MSAASALTPAARPIQEQLSSFRYVMFRFEKPKTTNGMTSALAAFHMHQNQPRNVFLVITRITSRSETLLLNTAHFAYGEMRTYTLDLNQGLQGQ